MGEFQLNDNFLTKTPMMATTKLAVLMATAAAIAIVSGSATTFTVAEAQIAISEKGVKADGQIALETGHWGIANSINQDACTNEVSQMKAPEVRDPNRSTDDQVQEVGTQSTECGDVTQSAEINNSVVDESTTNDESTTTTTINNARPPEN
jgi:hypothetical protein